MSMLIFLPLVIISICRSKHYVIYFKYKFKKSCVCISIDRCRYTLSDQFYWCCFYVSLTLLALLLWRTVTHTPLIAKLQPNYLLSMTQETTYMRSSNLKDVKRVEKSSNTSVLLRRKWASATDSLQNEKSGFKFLFFFYTFSLQCDFEAPLIYFPTPWI